MICQNDASLKIVQGDTIRFVKYKKQLVKVLKQH